MGSDISFEIGNPHIIQPGLNLNEDPFLPTKHELHAAYPNPFNPNVNIPFNIGSAGLVDLKIFDINGKLLFNEANLIAVRAELESISASIPSSCDRSWPRRKLYMSFFLLFDNVGVECMSIKYTVPNFKFK